MEARATSTTSRHTRWRNGSVTARIWGVGFVVLVSVVVVIAAMMWGGRSSASTVDKAHDEQVDETIPLLKAASSINRTMADISNMTSQSATTLSAQLSSLESEIAAIDAALAAVGSHVHDDAELVTFNRARDEWTQVRSELALAVRAPDLDTRDLHIANTFDAMSSAAADLETTAELSHLESIEETEQGVSQRRTTERLAIAVALIGLFASGLLMEKLAQSLAATLDELRVGATRIANGEQSFLVALQGPAEIVDVASSFNSMADALRDREATLTRHAYQDQLTGLGNRATLQQCLDVAMSQLRRRPADQFTVILLDLDRFKDLNDALGHSGGDEALVIIAERIRSCLRETDTACRLDGDEFVIVAPNATAASTELAERFLTAINKPLQIAGHATQLTASAGIALAIDGTESAADLIRQADLAMYAAKTEGGNRSEIFKETLLDDATRRNQIAEDLRGAIDTGQFEVHYQPIVDLEHRTVIGAEALVRWRHPERGLLSPAEFIDVAEHTGLIVPLGAEVLDIALRDSTRWRNQFAGVDAFRISVNVSAHQLALTNFVGDIEAALARSGAAPQHLCLELTETAMFKQPIDGKLHYLRDIGISIALDDFGTGYSSLHLMNTLDVDVIKIDRSFVSGISDLEELRSLVGAVIQMSTAFGRIVVAEGVETEEDATTLQELGASNAQGYWFGKAVAADEFEQRWLQGATSSPRRARERSRAHR